MTPYRAAPGPEEYTFFVLYGLSIFFFYKTVNCFF